MCFDKVFKLNNWNWLFLLRFGVFLNTQFRATMFQKKVSWLSSDSIQSDLVFGVVSVTRKLTPKSGETPKLRVLMYYFQLLVSRVATPKSRETPKLDAPKPRSHCTMQSWLWAKMIAITFWSWSHFWWSWSDLIYITFLVSGMNDRPSRSHF